MPPTHLALAREVEQFRQQFDELSQNADVLVEALSDEQFGWQLTPTRWSVAQCIEHLNTTARLYLPHLDEAIANPIRRGPYGEGPYSYNIYGRFLTAVMEPPVRFKVASPPAF